MRTRKHKRKTNHVVIVASDAVDTGVRQIRLNQKVIWVLVIVLCVGIGWVLGFILYGEQYKALIWESANKKIMEAQETNRQLQEELEAAETRRLELEGEIIALNGKIDILSDTVNQKTEAENSLKEQMVQQSTPSLYPMTGSASIEQITEGEPACILNGTEGTTVVAAANGVVAAVEEDPDYGSRVTVDHGNGYVTIYRNKGECLVKAGDTVVQRTTLFVIGNGNTKLSYQIQKDGEFINPMQMIELSG